MRNNALDSRETDSEGEFTGFRTGFEIGDPYLSWNEE